MGLQLYNKKRNFKETPEPAGKGSLSKSKLSFVIQRHKASRLHYDFRLEIGGTLKSWAVPRGPSLNPADKRLAMMVEDHPYDYKNFTGVIPEGNYGAGIVEIWDEGYLSDLGNSDKKTAEKKLRAGLKTGDLKFRLFGKKLKGEFALVKLKNGRQENAWLLIKHRDGHATDEAYDSEIHTAKNSPINKWLEKNKKITVKEKSAAVKTKPGSEALAGTSLKKKAKSQPDKPVKKKSGDGHPNEKILEFGKIKVKTTNLNKVFWPGEDITKGDVIDYYLSVSKYILPFLKDRPESLKRNPNGITDQGFFHKDAGNEAPGWVKSKTVFSESTNKDVEYIICNDQPTLTYLNNLGCIEINPWHSTIKTPDKPDYMIIDIDPAEKNTFDQVIEAANVIYNIIRRSGATAYCKTSGATGMHIYIPTAKKYTYDQLKDFAQLICILTQNELPEFTSLERNLKKRGDDMIYLDHLQNRRSQTISCVYSLRPRPGATVSMPLKWAEVKPGLTPAKFNIHNALKRIEKNNSLFSGVLGKGIDLRSCIKNLDR